MMRTVGRVKKSRAANRGDSPLEAIEGDVVVAFSRDVEVHIIRKMPRLGRQACIKATRVRLTDYYFKFTLRNVICSHKETPT